MERSAGNRRLALAAVAGLMLVSVYFLWELFQLRFQAGDVYPPYSSLRADPLGSMALHEAVVQAGGVEVIRNFRSLDRLQGLEGATVLFIGWPSFARLPRTFQTMAEGGMRLVLTIPPIHSRRDLEGSPKLAKEQDEEEKGADSYEDWVSLDRWDLRTSWSPLPAKAGRTQEAPVQRQAEADGRLPEVLPWHNTAVFNAFDPSWRVIYSRGDDPVVVERTFGAGSVVAVSDSYLFSNEALRRERHTDFIAWALGGAKRLVFDESHLGVSEDPGIAALLRRYGLEGVAAVLVVLAGLFVWRGASSFPPGRAEEAAGAGPVVLGKDSASGLVNLLRRGLPGSKLLAECLLLWEKSLDGTRTVSPERLAGVRKAFAAHHQAPVAARDPVKTYQEVRRILDRGKMQREGSPGSGI